MKVNKITKCNGQFNLTKLRHKNVSKFGYQYHTPAELKADLNFKQQHRCTVQFANGECFVLSLYMQRVSQTTDRKSRLLVDTLAHLQTHPEFDINNHQYYLQSLKNHAGLALQRLAISLLIGETIEQSTQTGDLLSALSKRGVEIHLA
ncbi:TPA: hypothetical protein ACT2HN_001861 [Pasteurella multocida]|uniref:hypothetical protein n=2 Tax=Pasteurellaceae TaxID=712 RepID=UPI0032FD02A6|nr:hypothetical protein [Pasteurella multocida]